MNKLPLSQAIRLGSMMCPKAIGLRHADDGSKCALGAAEFAIGVNSYDNRLREAIEAWPILLDTRIHPITRTTAVVYEIITTLNNGVLTLAKEGAYKDFRFTPWTREQIADLVETFEAEAPAAVALEETTA